MKHRLPLVMAFVGLLSLPLAAQRASSSDRKDYQIAVDILNIVNHYDRYTIFDDVTVNVKEGVVTLTGKVTYGIKAQEIAKNAQKVKGVVEVKNQIVTLPASKFDDQLRSAISNVIYSNSSFQEYAALEQKPIHIIVENGTVTLVGIVTSDVDRKLAQSLAMTSAATKVVNNLKTINEANDGLSR